MLLEVGAGPGGLRRREGGRAGRGRATQAAGRDVGCRVGLSSALNRPELLATARGRIRPMGGNERCGMDEARAGQKGEALLGIRGVGIGAQVTSRPRRVARRAFLRRRALCTAWKKAR